MKPTPERFLLGASYTDASNQRHSFTRSRPHGLPRVEVRQMPGGELLANPVVKTAAVAAYLENLT